MDNRVLHAVWVVWMGALGFGLGYLVNVVGLANEAGAFPESIGFALAAVAGLVGMLGVLFRRDERV